MAARRPLAVLFWTAIVAIAVQLTPTSAWAHAGHKHGPVATVEQPTVSHEIRANSERAGSTAIAEMTAASAAAADTRSGAASSGACHDPCCASGFSCCAPALLAEAPPDLPDGASRSDVGRAAPPMRAGIDPETLPKPPKSFS